MSQEIALIEMPEDRALEVFIAPKGLDPYLDQIAAEARSLVPDVSTKKGRDAIASNAHKVAKSKTALDNVRKKLADWLKEKPKLVDAEGKRMRDFLDALKDEVRKPLTDWEEAESVRKAKIESRLAVLSDAIRDNSERSSEEHRNWLHNIRLEPITEDVFSEYLQEAQRLHGNAIAAIEGRLASAEKREADEAELANLRAEAAERQAKEQAEQAERDRIAAEEKAKADQAERERVAAENARIEAEDKAKAELASAAQREADAKAAQERAEQARLDAERRALAAAEQAEISRLAAEQRAEQEKQEAIAAERRRQEAEAKRVADEQAKRERDTAHKKKINNAAVDALIDGGIDEATAKKVITLIAKKQVPNCEIKY